MLPRRGTGKKGAETGAKRRRIAYFDCSSGISGDMCLGALVDAGVSLEKLSTALKRLPLRGYRLERKKVLRAGLAATKVDVVAASKGPRTPAASWEYVRSIILSSSLREEIASKGLAVFKLLFDAEAKVHGTTAGKVHLHELGAVDCMVDIFGTLIGLDLLGVDEVYASAVNLGSGTIKTCHGIMPVPAPATAEILKHMAVYSSGIPYELATPTGAALLKYLAKGVVAVPAFTPDTIGTGAGSRDTGDSPNVLRIFAGLAADAPNAAERVTIIETNIDDMNPQIYEYLTERLFLAGALDVSLTQTVMKKMRPAVLLTVLCEKASRDSLIDIILRETTTIGVRYHEVSRVTMDRQIRQVKTRGGSVRVKFSSRGDVRKAMPEYDDCRKAAKKSGASLIEIAEEAKRAAGREGRNR